jgi:RecA-family ATPase
VPPREWLVKDLVPAKNCTLLSGDGGTGKSTVAMQLAVATALGARTWMGAEVMRGPVVFLTAEDDEEEMHRRFNAIARKEGVDLDRLDNLHIISLAGKDAVLAAPTPQRLMMPTQLWGAFRKFVLAVQPKLVVYDPLADLFAGNENARPEARQFIGMLRGLAIETRSTALLLGHPSMSGMASGTGTSGSTAWSNSVRSRLFLDRIREDGKDGIEPDPDARVLRTMKANYAQAGRQIRLRWRDGVFICIDDDASGGPTAKELQADQLFLMLVEQYSTEGRSVSASKSANYAPTVFADDPRAKGFGFKALQAAMNRQLAAGRIRVEEFGPPSRRRTRLVVS